MKAIDTHYAGCLFRSRLEARWAVFFDALGEPWEYEKEGFELPSGRYLPDFWLPWLGCWLEIKGEEPTPAEEKLCEELAHATDKPVLMAWGLPRSIEDWVLYDNYGRDYLQESPWLPDYSMQMFCGVIELVGDDNLENKVVLWLKLVNFVLTNQWRGLRISENSSRRNRFFSPSFSRPFPTMERLQFDEDGLLIGPINAAKSARFEFGQTPVARR